MSRITTNIELAFDTKEPITCEKFDELKTLLEKMIENFEMSVFETCESVDVECDTFFPLIHDGFEIDYSDDENEEDEDEI